MDALVLEQERVRYLLDSNARLTEQLLKKDNHIVVQLPDAPRTAAPGVPVVAAPNATEPANIWGDMNRGSGHTIATPPKPVVMPERVSAPKQIRR